MRVSFSLLHDRLKDDLSEQIVPRRYPVKIKRWAELPISGFQICGNWLGSRELYSSFRDDERPFVGVVDAASSVRIEFTFWIVAPRPQIVATLYQIGKYDIVIPRKGKAAPTTLAMSLGLVEIHRDGDRYSSIVPNPNCGLSASLR